MALLRFQTQISQHQADAALRLAPSGTFVRPCI
jgi:hypothetical protein